MDSLSEALEDTHIESSDLKKVRKIVRKLILEADFPEDLAKAIVEAYKKLGGTPFFIYIFKIFLFYICIALFGT
jgi:phosphoenolpyruvate synthase/pyruvate phosphate dikinase